MNTNEELRRLAQNWRHNATVFLSVAQQWPYPDEQPLSHHAAVYDACASQLLEVLDAAEAQRDKTAQDKEYLRIMQNVEALLGKTERQA